jgi:hypothetical protein
MTNARLTILTVPQSSTGRRLLSEQAVTADGILFR